MSVLKPELEPYYSSGTFQDSSPLHLVKCQFLLEQTKTHLYPVLIHPHPYPPSSSPLRRSLDNVHSPPTVTSTSLLLPKVSVKPPSKGSRMLTQPTLPTPLPFVVPTEYLKTELFDPRTLSTHPLVKPSPSLKTKLNSSNSVALPLQFTSAVFYHT